MGSFADIPVGKPLSLNTLRTYRLASIYHKNSDQPSGGSIYSFDNDSLYALATGKILNFTAIKTLYRPKKYKSSNNPYAYTYTSKFIYQDIQAGTFPVKLNVLNTAPTDSILKSKTVLMDYTRPYALEMKTPSGKLTLKNRLRRTQVFYSKVMASDLPSAVVFKVNSNSGDFKFYSSYRLSMELPSLFFDALRLKDVSFFDPFVNKFLTFIGTKYSLTYKITEDDLNDFSAFAKSFRTSFKKFFMQDRVATPKPGTNTAFSNLYKVKASGAEKAPANPDKAKVNPNSTDNKDDADQPVKLTKNEKLDQSVEEVMDQLAKIGITVDGDGNEIAPVLQTSLRQGLKDTMKADPTLAKIKDPADRLNQLLSHDIVANDVTAIKNIRLKGSSTVRDIKKVHMLEDRQDSVIKSMDDLHKELQVAQKREIDIPVNNDVTLLMEEPKKVTKVKAFDDSYMEKQYDDDMLSSFTAFNEDPDIPLFVTSFKKTSENNTKLDKLDTYHIQLTGENGTRHTITVDIPRIYDGKYMYLNGSKKIITKQLVSKPVVKVKPDEVYITTNYNKINVKRFGSQYSESLSSLSKIFKDTELMKSAKVNKTFKFTYGKSDDVNSKYTVSLAYDSISTYLLNLEADKVILDFNQDNIKERLTSTPKYANITFDTEKYFPVGVIKNEAKILVSDFTSGKLYTVNKAAKYEEFADGLNEYIYSLIENNTTYDLAKKMKTQTNASLAYTRVFVLGKNVPLVTLLGYEKGLTPVLLKTGMKYEFSDKNRALNVSDKTGKIRFADGYLYYDASLTRNVLLMSGLRAMNTSQYPFNDFNTRTPYLDYFDQNFGSRTVGRGFHNTLSFMIDPITKDVLEQLDQPTNMFDLLLYANSLLEGLSYSRPNDLNTYRVRTGEQVPALVYNILSQEIGKYKFTVDSNNPGKISLPRDIVIRKLTDLQTVESASDLNPVLTMETEGKVGFKGLTGQNNDDTYTPAIRAYSDTYKGVLSSTSPDSNKVGVVRFMTYNPNITNTRGLMDTDAAKNGSVDTNSIGELLTPFVAQVDDPPRLSMMVQQSKHTTPLKNADVPLYGTGIEKTIADSMPNGFVIHAKEDGKVVKYDKENNLLFLEYFNGEKDVIDLANNISHNSGGGFYENLQYDVLASRAGQRFKKNEILAKVDSYFKGSKSSDITYSMGHLTKVALTQLDQTYEDSTVITSGLSKDMTTKVTMEKGVSLNAGSNVSFIAKKGQDIKTSEPLLVFEDSFEDDSISNALDKLGDEYKQTIAELGNKVISSKYTGTIVDVRIYRNRPLDDFSPSLKKIISAYEKEYSKKNKMIDDYLPEEKQNLYSNNVPELGEISADKIRGKDVDGCLIEFYIEYEDTMSVGDKLTAYTALKAVVADVIPEDEAPYSDYRGTDENIQLLFSPLSIVSRMTQSIYYDMYLNKGMIELKRQIAEMLGEKPKFLGK